MIKDGPLERMQRTALKKAAKHGGRGFLHGLMAKYWLALAGNVDTYNKIGKKATRVTK